MDKIHRERERQRQQNAKRYVFSAYFYKLRSITEAPRLSSFLDADSQPNDFAINVSIIMYFLCGRSRTR